MFLSIKRFQPHPAFDQPADVFFFILCDAGWSGNAVLWLETHRHQPTSHSSTSFLSSFSYILVLGSGRRWVGSVPSPAIDFLVFYVGPEIMERFFIFISHFFTLTAVSNKYFLLINRRPWGRRRWKWIILESLQRAGSFLFCWCSLAFKN